MKGREKTLAERDREMLDAYMVLAQAGQQAFDNIAAGRSVDQEDISRAMSSFRTSVKNRNKAAKKLRS